MVETARSILVVEDDEALREVLVGALEDAGYRVTAAANGRDALAALERAEALPHLVVLDLMMPIMDGWELRARLKQDARFASIAVLAMSADATAKASAIDAEAYVHKPASLDEMLAGVRRALGAPRRDSWSLAGLAQAERVAALGTLAAGVAHELNNPLAFVRVNTEWIETELAALEAEVAAIGSEAGAPAALAQIAARLREAAAVARESIDGIDRAARIVRDVGAFSRVRDEEAGPTDVREALTSAIRIVQGQIRPRARLVCEIEPVPHVLATSGRLCEVFVNLLTNAAQAIRGGDAAHNEVRVTTRTGADREAIVEIADTGQGIPDEILDRIFEPFFTTKPQGLGTGLGLAVAQRTVAALGGRIEVERRDARSGGTLFRVILPEIDLSKQEGPSEADAPPARAAGARLRILVVDDEVNLARSLARLLGKRHDVVTATGGAEALRLLDDDARFDAIVCDVVMPDVGGIELFEALRARGDHVADRIVFMSGGAFTPEAAVFLARVQNPLIEKPIDVEAVEAAVEEIARRA